MTHSQPKRPLTLTKNAYSKMSICEFAQVSLVFVKASIAQHNKYSQGVVIPALENAPSGHDPWPLELPESHEGVDIEFRLDEPMWPLMSRSSPSARRFE